MRDLLAIVLNRSDALEPRFSGDEVVAWPTGALQHLLHAGLIREVENATSVACDACADAHVEEVVLIKSVRETTPRAYIPCPENDRVRVLLERLRQWEVDFVGLAAVVARAMDLAGDMEETIPGRVWFMGKTTLAALSREVFLARGLSWRDARSVLGRSPRLNAAKTALVFAAGRVPPLSAWNGDPPSVVALKTVMALTASGATVDKVHLESLLSTGRKKTAPVPMKTFPTPAGTTWPEIRIVVSETELGITARGKTRRYSFQDAGFEERRRKNVPNRLWRLLTLFAAQGGVLPFKAVGVKDRDNLKQYVSDLRDRIKALIPGIEGDFICYDLKQKSYRTAFRISSEETLQFPTPGGVSWSDVAIAKSGPTGIRISVAATERFAVSSYADEDDDTTHQWDGAEREGSVERTYDLRMLKLADDQDRPNRAGQALLAVLAGKGAVTRKAGDKGMLDLCGVLTKLMGLDDSPFEFSRIGEKWVARFDAR